MVIGLRSDAQHFTATTGDRSKGYEYNQNLILPRIPSREMLLIEVLRLTASTTLERALKIAKQNLYH